MGDRESIAPKFKLRHYLISFGFDNRLCRIVVISRLFENDPQGAAAKVRYQELLASLTEKYGKPRSIHSLGESNYARPDWFTYGLHEGKSFWYSDFADPEVGVQLGIQGELSGSARWRIFYENKALMRSFRESKRLKEKGSL